MGNANSNAIPNRVIDLSGQVFGKWSVLSFAGLTSRNQAAWLCRCECGNERIVLGTALNCHRSQKCSSCARQSHGMNKCPEYNAWSNMIQRCYNPKAQQFINYGARGIAVCQRWRDSFASFYEDMGPRPSPEHSIDRIDNEGNYDQDNCRWTTAEAQARNRRTSRLLTFNGESMCLAEWADRFGLRRDTLRNRLTRGWSLERALTTPSS